MRRLRLILARAACAGLLGIATSLVLAWLLAAVLPHRNLSYRKNLVGTPAQYVTIFEFSRPGMLRRDWRAGFTFNSPLWSQLGPVSTLRLGNATVVQDRSWGELPEALLRPTRTTLGAEDARGWPWLCVSCAINVPVIESGAPGPVSRDGVPISRLTTTTTLANVRILPLRPIWPGLAADTAVYAVAWAVGVPLFRAARASVRRRRGLCPRCAYRLGHGQGCPECGLGLNAAA